MAERDLISLIKFNESGRDENILPLRHKKMKESLFNFLRGTALVQAFDLASETSSNVIVQCSGDAHILNFAGYLLTPDNYFFDITDLDETYPAPFEWDLKRLALSIVVAGRENGIKHSDNIENVEIAVSKYRDWIIKNYKNTFIENKYKMVTLDFSEKTDLKKEFKFESDVVLKMTVLDDNNSYKIKNIEDEIFHFTPPDSQEEKNIVKYFDVYKNTLSPDGKHAFEKMNLMDIAVKQTGVGSIGLKKYMALFKIYDGDLIALEIKQERESSLEIALNENLDSTQLQNGGNENNANRVFCAEKILRSANDIFAGWGSTESNLVLYTRRFIYNKVTFSIYKVTFF